MKNIMIFGDSYSTFDYCVPKGYAVYYHIKPRPETDVTRVEETWWHGLCEEKSLNLVRNDSWSGSTVGYTGWNGADTSKTSSFIYRLEKLTEEGFFEKNKIDTVLIFGTTNDSWCNAPLGEIKLEGIERDDLFSVCPAICYFVGKVKSALPEADILFMINTGLKEEVCDAIRAACEHFGARFLELQDIDKRCGHPTIAGMKSIKEQVAAVL